MNVPRDSIDVNSISAEYGRNERAVMLKSKLHAAARASLITHETGKRSESHNGKLPLQPISCLALLLTALANSIGDSQGTRTEPAPAKTPRLLLRSVDRSTDLQNLSESTPAETLDARRSAAKCRARTDVTSTSSRTVVAAAASKLNAG